MKTIISLILFLSVFLNISCHKIPWDGGGNKGKDTIPKNVWVEITDTIVPDIGCTYKPGGQIGGPTNLNYDVLLIINEQIHYEDLLIDLDSINCHNPNPPSIDFNIKTLLGYSFEEIPNYSFSRFFKNDSLREYKLFIDVKIINDIDLPYSVRQWIVVPKVNNSYKVVVEKSIHK